MSRYQKIYHTCGEATIYYEKSKGDPVLVFLHGATLNHTIFNRQRSYFSRKGYGTLALDLAGHGKSSPARSYALQECTKDLEQILDHEHIKNPILVGHSAGAMITQQYAATHDISGMVLIATSYHLRKTFMRNAPRKLFCFLRPHIENVVLSLNTLLSPKEGYYPNYSSPLFHTITPQRFVYELLTKTPPARAQEYRHLGEKVLSWDTTSILPNVKCPTIIIAAEHDILIPLPTPYEVASMLPNCKGVTIIPKANHGVVFTHPKEVTRAMSDFLKTL